MEKNMEKLGMVNKLFIGTMLAGLLFVLLGGCTGSDANKRSVTNVTNSSDTAGKNTAAANENPVEANKKSGGQLTVITGADKSAVKVRSTWFTWASCVTRVVDALKARSEVKEVIFDKEVRPLTVTVLFDAQSLNPKLIGEVAEKALESDEHNTSPVTVIYEEEK